MIRRARLILALVVLLTMALSPCLPALAEDATANTLELSDLRQELDNVQAVDITVDPSDGLLKNQQATVSFTLTAGDGPDAQALLELLDAHSAFYVQTGPLNVPMQRVEDTWTYTATLSLPTAGTYILHITCIVDTDEIDPYIAETFNVDVTNRRPTKALEAIPDLPAELTPKHDQIELKAATLFSDPDEDAMFLSVSITDSEGATVRISETPEGYVLDGSGDMTSVMQQEVVTLIFTEPGAYTLRVTGSDGLDEAEEGYTAVITLLSARDMWLRLLLYVAAGVAAALVLLLILRQFTKPSYAGKSMTISTRTGAWSQETTLSLDAWKKKKQPFSWLLTAAACPADEALYRPFADVIVKPSRHGVTLSNTQALTGRKAEQLTPGSPLKLTAGGYDVTLSINEKA